MSTEISGLPQRPENTAHSTEPAPVGQLSQEVFANPHDFLATLKSILPKANPGDLDDVTKNDLVAYSNNGDNAQDRAAAAIAANHFDQLRQMPTSFSGDYFWGTRGLSQKEVDVDQDMASGNVQDRVQKDQVHDAVMSVVNGGGAVGAGLLAVGLSEAPPAAIALGAGAVGFALLAGGYAAHVINLPKAAAAQSSKDQQVLASWPEINGNTNVAR